MSYASCLVRTEDLTADSLVLFIAIREWSQYVCTYECMCVYVCVSMYLCMYICIPTYLRRCLYVYPRTQHPLKTKTRYMNTVLVEKLIVAKLVCPQGTPTIPVRIHIYPSLFPLPGQTNRVCLVKKLIYNALNWPNFSYSCHFQTLRSKILSSEPNSQKPSTCLLTFAGDTKFRGIGNRKVKPCCYFILLIPRLIDNWFTTWTSKMHKLAPQIVIL